MKNIIGFLLSALIISCSTDSKEDKWFTGGTLHNATIAEWKIATDKNKLATCGEFLVKVDNTVPELELIKRTQAIIICVDEATKNQEFTDSAMVSQIASICALKLGYLDNL